jgi:hypothetical protein
MLLAEKVEKLAEKKMGSQPLQNSSGQASASKFDFCFA